MQFYKINQKHDTFRIFCCSFASRQNTFCVVSGAKTLAVDLLICVRYDLDDFWAGDMKEATAMREYCRHEGFNPRWQFIRWCSNLVFVKVTQVFTFATFSPCPAHRLWEPIISQPCTVIIAQSARFILRIDVFAQTRHYYYYYIYREYVKTLNCYKYLNSFLFFDLICTFTCTHNTPYLKKMYCRHFVLKKRRKTIFLNLEALSQPLELFQTWWGNIVEHCPLYFEQF